MGRPYRRNAGHNVVNVKRIRIEDMAAIAQLGERRTEDLKVPGSIPGLGIALDSWFSLAS